MAHPHRGNSQGGLAMNRVKEIRQAKGLNQRQLAELSHSPQSAVSNIELGKWKAWPKVMQRIAQALRVRVEELFPEDKATNK
jgi:transcriptional regulator with XRE-family HTH domain